MVAPGATPMAPALEPTMSSAISVPCEESGHGAVAAPAPSCEAWPLGQMLGAMSMLKQASPTSLPCSPGELVANPPLSMTTTVVPCPSYPCACAGRALTASAGWSELCPKALALSEPARQKAMGAGLGRGGVSRIFDPPSG